MTVVCWLLLAVLFAATVVAPTARQARRRRPSSCSWHYCHANHQHTPHK